MNGRYLIASKTAPPALQRGALKREALLQKIKESKQTQLIFITAAGGYGKTVLASQIAEESSNPSVWFRLDEADNDPAIFFSYLLRALGGTAENRAQDFSLFLSGVGSGRDNAFSAAAYLLQFIDTDAYPMNIVFDDFHVIHEPYIINFLDTFFKYLPATLHVIITSRQPLPFDVQKFRDSGTLFEINQENIRFTYEEFLHYLDAQSSVTAAIKDEVSLKDIYEKSEGWALPLTVCARELGVNPTQIEKTLQRIQSGKPFFDFFAMQVFDRLSLDERDFLVSVSVLDKLTVDACAALSGNSKADEILKGLSRKNMFINSHPELAGVYTCHQLFQEFLLDRLGTLAKTKFLAAGDYYFNQKQFEEALEYYIRCKEPHKAIEAFEPICIQTVQDGRLKTAERWIFFFSGWDFTQNTWVVLTQSLICLYRGMYDISEMYLDKIWNALEKDNNCDKYGVGLVIRSRILMYRYSLNQGIQCADRIIKLHYYVNEYTLYDAIMQKAHGQILKGDFDESVLTLEMGIDIMNRKNCSRFSAYLKRYLTIPYFMKFQYKQALAYYTAAAECAEPEVNLTERFSIDLYCARIYRDTGRLEEARELIEKIIRRKRAFGYEEDLYYVYYQFAMTLRDLGDLEQALKYDMLSEELFTSSGSSMEFSHFVRVLRALIVSDMGKCSEAYETVQQAVSGLEAGSSKSMLGIAYHVAGIVALRCADTSKAEHYLKQGYGISQTTSLKSMGPVCAGLLVGIYIKKNLQMAVKYTYISLTQAAAQNYIQVYLTNAEMDSCLALGFINEVELDFVLKIIHRLNAERVSRLLRIIVLFGGDESIARFLQAIENILPFGETLEGVSAALTAYDEPNIDSLIASASHVFASWQGAPGMIVRCFGDFKIYSLPGDGTGVSWRTRKSQELFAYLIHHAERNILSEKLLADIWPDTPVDKARDLFYTNLAHVRKILKACGLEQNLLKIPSGYCFKKDNIFCDEWLLQEYRRGRRKKDQNLLALVKKEYLDGMYSDWVLEARNEYQNADQHT